MTDKPRKRKRGKSDVASEPAATKRSPVGQKSSTTTAAASVVTSSSSGRGSGGRGRGRRAALGRGGSALADASPPHPATSSSADSRGTARTPARAAAAATVPRDGGNSTTTPSGPQPGASKCRSGKAEKKPMAAVPVATPQNSGLLVEKQSDPVASTTSSAVEAAPKAPSAAQSLTITPSALPAPMPEAMQLGALAASAAAAARSSTASVPSRREGVPFLRLSSSSKPTQLNKQIVYFNKDEVLVGRLPNCDVILESTQHPQMISRVHGRFVRQRCQDGAQAGADVWMLHDNRSLNGIRVNSTRVTEGGHMLQTGDVIVFGCLVQPPEFEYVFEDPVAATAAASAVAAEAAAGAMEELFAQQLQRMTDLQSELNAEREQRTQEMHRKAKEADISAAIQSELECSICRDWLVHAASIECGHNFCWNCVDTWLLGKKFECPVCRAHVSREPVRCRALDAVVQQSVDRSGEATCQEYAQRVQKAEEAAEKNRHRLEVLEGSISQAKKKKKDFFTIDENWSRKSKDVFQRGVEGYSGAARVTYCKLIGLTEQWVYSASDSQLNQALHNLQLQTYVNKEEDEIRQRMLMFMKYG